MQACSCPQKRLISSDAGSRTQVAHVPRARGRVRVRQDHRPAVAPVLRRKRSLSKPDESAPKVPLQSSLLQLLVQRMRTAVRRLPESAPSKLKNERKPAPRQRSPLKRSKKIRKVCPHHGGQVQIWGKKSRTGNLCPHLEAEVVHVVSRHRESAAERLRQKKELSFMSGSYHAMLQRHI